MELYQTKKLVYSKGNHQKTKSQLTKCEKLFANDISDKEINIQNI